MEDRKLLELAAKAAGMLMRVSSDGDFFADKVGNGYFGYWNPLEDDGDALRLAVKLHFCVSYLNADSDYPPKSHGAIVTPFSPYSVCWPSETKWVIERDENEHAATRRAIVRAAAEIGKTL